MLNKGVKHCWLSFSTHIYRSWLCARHCALPCGKSEAQRVAKFAQGHRAHKNQGRAGPMSVWGQSLNVTSRTLNCSSDICEHLLCARASQVALVVKNSPANAGDTRDADSIPGSGRSPWVGNGNPLQYFCLEKSHGQRSLVGSIGSVGCRVSDTTEQLRTCIRMYLLSQSHSPSFFR